MRALGIVSAGGPLGLSLVLASMLGCGGATTSGEGGPPATCGESCSPAQVMPACSAACAKIAQAGCSSGTGDCVTSCSQLVTMTPACGTASSAFLQCIDSMSPTCASSGGAQFVACSAEEQTLEDCLADSGPPPTTTTTVPAGVCPVIPRPTGQALSCSGGAVVSASGGGPTSCQASCHDSAGNNWEAACSGSTCKCTFNSYDACNCTMTGSGCNSCCPGTN